MKSTCVLVAALVVGAAVAVAAQPLRAVRPLDDASSEALASGQRHSAAFRALVEDVEATGVIVHVATGDLERFGAAGTTRLVGVAEGQRYLRVMLRPRLALAERASVLAHELQHVREIAQAGATTQDGVRRVFARVGHPVAGVINTFETDAVVDAGLRVWRELYTALRVARRTSELR